MTVNSEIGQDSKGRFTKGNTAFRNRKATYAGHILKTSDGSLFLDNYPHATEELLEFLYPTATQDYLPQYQ